VGRRRSERTGGHTQEDWRSWWDAAARDPELADLFDERERRRPARGGSGDERVTVRRHARLLRRAGFAHVAPVWQFGDSAVLVAVLDGAPAAHDPVGA
jgi:hypothetical protein